MRFTRTVLPPLLATATLCLLLALTLHRPATAPLAAQRPFSPPEVLADLDSGLSEISGMCPSRLHPGDFWVHEDGGGVPLLFRFSPDGHMRQMVAVAGVLAEDIEDLALGPLPDGAGFGLFLADTGDNEADDQEFEIIVLDEGGTAGSDVVRPVRILRARYPDDAFNCEALLVMPTTGEVYLVSKARDESTLLHVPVASGEAQSAPVLAGEVAEIDLDEFTDEGHPNRLTGGAVSPLGDAVALRTEDHVFVFALNGDDLADALQQPPTAILPTPDEPQGEAVTFDLDGRDLFTASERTDLIWRHAR